MVTGRFVHCISIIVSKGRSHHLLKKKLLRDQREEKNKIEEEKEQALLSITPMRNNNWFNRWNKMAQKLLFMINCYHLMDSFEKVGLLPVLALWVPCGLTLPLEEINDRMTLEMNEPKNAFRMVGLLGEGIPRVDNTLTLPSEAFSLVSIKIDFNPSYTIS